jgi:hypothetical protein
MRAFFPISFLLVCLGMSTQTAYGSTPFALVELFSSEGCSSCPPADDLLRAINKKAADEHLRVFALSFQVDYWNSLGWVDPYSKKEFTARQWEYAKKKNETSVYTPQMVVNGNQLFNGAIEDLAYQYIDQYLQAPAANSIQFVITNQGSQIQVDYKLESPAKGMLINIAIVISAAITQPLPRRIVSQNRHRYQIKLCAEIHPVHWL